MLQIEFRKQLPQWSGKSRLRTLISVFTREIINYIQTKYKVKEPLLYPLYKILYDDEKQTEYLSILWYVDDGDLAVKSKIIWLNTTYSKPMMKRYISNKKRGHCYA